MKKRFQRVMAVALAVIMCMQLDFIPVKASAQNVTDGNAVAGDVSKGDVSTGDVSDGNQSETEREEVNEKSITVSFETTYASGSYSTGGDWSEISGSVSLVLKKGEDFYLAVKTEQPAFISRYSWNGSEDEKITGNSQMTYVEVRKNWDSLKDNDCLTVSFDQAISPEQFVLILNEQEGTYGYTTVAGLYLAGTQEVDLTNVQIQWNSNYSGLVPSGQPAADEAIGKCTYTVKANEDYSANAIARLYRNDILLCTVTSAEYRIVKDTLAPQVTEVLYSTDGNIYQDFSGRQHIWTFGKVWFRVKVTDEADGTLASGVQKVNILVNNKTNAMQYNEADGYYEYTVTPVLGSVFIFNIKIDAFDNAGNHILNEQYPEIGIDQKGPEVEAELVAGESVITGWYSETVGTEKLRFEIHAADDNAVNLIEIATKADFSAGSILVSQEPKLQDEKYVLETTEGLITGEQNRTYYIRAKDEFGNLSEVVSKQVKIDNTAPSDVVVVGFTGTQNMLVEIDDYDQKEQTYLVSKGAGIIYDNDAVALRIHVKDNVTGGIQSNVSGIATVDFNIIIENSEGITEIPVHKTESSFTVAEDKSVVVYFETMLPDGLEQFEQSYKIDKIVITDKAGNVCPVDTENGEKILSDSVLYAVDNKAPEIFYEYENDTIGAPNIVEEEGVKTYYYNQQFTGNLLISDMNLALNSICLMNGEGCDEAVFSPGLMESEEQVWKNALFTYSLSQDGNYQLIVEADDILHNGVVEGEIVQAVSERMVVDTKAPVIEVVVTNNNGQVLSDYAGKYYSCDLGAGIKIYDKNLDLDSVVVTITGRSVDGKTFVEELSKDSWQQNGYEYTNNCLFSSEGSYSITIQCKDMAGNTAAAATETFSIDKTAPKAEISFDNMNAANGFYYNADRKAVITVKDFSFNPQAANIMVQAQYGSNAVIGDWQHHAADGCQEMHTAECTYSVTVTFSQDDVYDLSFQCTDFAGNVSEKSDGGHFVVDKTAPVITVSYNNNDVRNEIYYNKSRTATIVIEDMSFSDEASGITRMAVEGLNELPSQSSWQLWNGNKYVKQMEFSQDGIYQYQVSAADLAGNQAQIVYSDYFILDMTAPRLEISGVADRSANNGEVIPVITYGDKYLNDSQAEVTVEGTQNTNFHFVYTKEAAGDGYQITGQDFAYTASNDDLYTLTARIEDYAGNITEQSILFSVNRFGSVYVLSEGTRQWLDGYYSNREREIVVTEINVDELSKADVTISRDGEIISLKEARDYQINGEGTDSSWKSYTYVLYEENFVQEGHYIVTLSSEDAANNKSDNKVKGLEIAFAIDKTAPQMVVAGIESNGVYKQNSLEVRADIQDNMSLNQVCVYMNDKLWKTFEKETLEQNAGVISFELPETKGLTEIRMVAEDSVGNSSEEVFSDVLISTDYKVIEETMTATAAGKNVMLFGSRLYLWLILLMILAAGTAGAIIIFAKKKSRQ